MDFEQIAVDAGEGNPDLELEEPDGAIPIDYEAGIDWEDGVPPEEALGIDEPFTVEIGTEQNEINLNVDELDEVLSTHLEPLGSSILDIIDPSVLRDALGVGSAQTNLNAPTFNETPNQVIGDNTNNTTNIENQYMLTDEEKIEQYQQSGDYFLFEEFAEEVR